VNKRQFDAIVVGGGAAGLYTALCLSESLSANSSGLAARKICLITKDNLSISASDWAQGGIAAVMHSDDSSLLHAEDTLKAGAGLCEPAAVKVLVDSARTQIEKLITLGVDFDREIGGLLAMTLEAAHSRRRVLHAADATGHALVSKLAARVLERENIQVLSETIVLDLLMQQGRCNGLFCFSLNQNLSDNTSEIECLIAPVVVLATGGGAHVFSQTTNPPSSTGDGVSIAWRAGGLVRDMEFVQFHPTALAVTDAPRFLISEAVRGEGAHLVDDKGDRFTFEYDPHGELAPRDVVSRAVFTHLQKTGASTVFLDLKPIPLDRIAHRFPNIIKICQQWQIDIFSEPIPVTPAAHYCMGGIVTDADGKTSISGLYALGETASTGVHGANRLASNSLLECFVFGVRLAESVIKDQIDLQVDLQALIDYPQVLDPVPEIFNAQTQAIKDALRSLVWQSAGICRQKAELEQALTQIQAWRQELVNLKSYTRLWVETNNLADFAYLLVKSALFRTESRGAHFRLDYPDPDPTWQQHTLIHAEEISRSPLASEI